MSTTSRRCALPTTRLPRHFWSAATSPPGSTASGRCVRERMLADSQAVAHVGSWEWDVSGEQMVWSDELCWATRPFSTWVTCLIGMRGDGRHNDKRWLVGVG